MCLHLKAGDPGGSVSSIFRNTKSDQVAPCRIVWIRGGRVKVPQQSLVEALRDLAGLHINLYPNLSVCPAHNYSSIYLSKSWYSQEFLLYEIAIHKRHVDSCSPGLWDVKLLSKYLIPSYVQKKVKSRMFGRKRVGRQYALLSQKTKQSFFSFSSLK